MSLIHMMQLLLLAIIQDQRVGTEADVIQYQIVSKDFSSVFPAEYTTIKLKSILLLIKLCKRKSKNPKTAEVDGPLQS